MILFLQVHKEFSTSCNNCLIESIDVSYSRCHEKYGKVLHLFSNTAHQREIRPFVLRALADHELGEVNKWY